MEDDSQDASESDHNADKGIVENSKVNSAKRRAVSAVAQNQPPAAAVAAEAAAAGFERMDIDGEEDEEMQVPRRCPHLQYIVFCASLKHFQ